MTREMNSKAQWINRLKYRSVSELTSINKYTHIILVSFKRREYTVTSKLYDFLRLIQTKVLVTNESLDELRFHDLFLDVRNVATHKTFDLLLNGMGIDQFSIAHALPDSP